MTQYKRIGIDTSKAVFTLHGVDQQDRPVLRNNLRRPQLLAFFKSFYRPRFRHGSLWQRAPLGSRTDRAWP